MASDIYIGILKKNRGGLQLSQPKKSKSPNHKRVSRRNNRYKIDTLSSLKPKDLTFTEIWSILSFTILFKQNSPQGFIYKHDIKRCYIKYNFKQNISYTTFSKYVKLLNDTGLLIDYQSGTKQLISLFYIIEKLGLDTILYERQFKQTLSSMIAYENINKRKIRFCKLRRIVFDAFVLRDLHNQKYKADENRQKRNLAIRMQDTSKTKASLKDIKKISKEAKSIGMSFDDYLNELASNGNDNIVTGCIHLASKSGMDFRYTNNSLNRLKDKGYIHRNIVYTKTKVFGYEELEYNSFFNKKANILVKVIGSIISINTLSSISKA